MKTKNKPGRPANGVPYRRPRDGKWVVRDPKLRELTGAITKEDALRIMQQASSTVVAIDDGLVMKPVAPAVDSKVPEPSTNPLATFLGTAPQKAPDDPSKDGSQNTTSTSPAVTNKPGVVMSDAERNQMHGMLSGMVGQLNVTVIALGVKAFGRQPEMPKPEDMQLLEKAWQMQLNIWFADAPIQPWVCILAASVALGFAMWAGGEPLPPKPKKGKPGANLVSIQGGGAQDTGAP